MNAPAFFVVAAEVARLRRREVGRSPPNRYGPRGKYMPFFPHCASSPAIIRKPTPTLRRRRCARPDTKSFACRPRSETHCISTAMILLKFASAMTMTKKMPMTWQARYALTPSASLSRLAGTSTASALRTHCRLSTYF